MLLLTELNIAIDNVYMYILVFVRLAGIIVFNPMFSRNNVPTMVKTGIIIGATVLLTPSVQIPAGYENDGFELILCIIRELAVGWLLGYVFNIFFYMLAFVGDILDMQFGFSMAKVLDPGTGIQSAFAGKLIDMIFLGYFFVTNTHLVLIKTIVYSYNLIPAGAANINIHAAAGFGIDIFTSAFSMAVRLLFPFVAMEFVLELGMGILMKLIPQIHIFVINMQFKILLAIAMLFILARPITVFTENYILSIVDNLQSAIKTLVS